MPSLREQILARCATVLAGATPAGANVFRAREVSIIRAVTPAICVLYAGDQGVERNGGVDVHHITIQVAIFVRGDPWDSLADAVDVPAHAALMADPGLQALGCQLLREGDEPEAQEADRTAGTLTVSYRATFRTRAADISAAP